MTATTKPYGLPELVALLEPLPHDPDEAWGAPAIAGELSGQYGLQLPYHALLPDGLHVRPEKELVGLGVPPAEVAALRWAPRGTGRPALPLPFDSHDLAAFMLDGWGLELQDYWELSSLEDGGDDARTLALVPTAREAITQALRLREGVYCDFDLARQPPVCLAGSVEDGAYSAWRAGALVDATLALFAAAPTATQHGDAASAPAPEEPPVIEPLVIKPPVPGETPWIEPPVTSAIVHTATLALLRSSELRAGQPEDTPKPVPRHRAQEQAILSALKTLGFDPLALPRYDAGKKSHAKAGARAALPYSRAVFDKAWNRLRASEDIQDA